MGKVPARCGMCRDIAEMNYEGSTLFQCAHKGGWDSKGKPGFVVPSHVPPIWCPRRNGIFTQIFQNMWGSKKGSVSSGAKSESTASSDGKFTVNENPEMAKLRAELRAEKEKNQALEAEKGLRQAPPPPEEQSFSQEAMESVDIKVEVQREG